ncbi:MAG: ABC transporter substrate-binding protein [Clostridia bacterium]|nr:ABC transporter substrate-binding protein [Clostridia bacterium]
MRKLIPAILAFLLLAVLIAPVGAAKKTTITFWQAGGDAVSSAVIRDIIKDFEAENPDIKVNFQAIPWGEDPHVKFQVAIVGGTIADVFTVGDPFEHVLAASNALEPLDGYASKGMLADFYPVFIERGTFSGQLVSLPWFGTIRAMFYRKDLLAAAGVPEPTTSWTWDEFVTYAKKLTRDLNGDGVIDQYGFGTSGRYVSQFQPFVKQNGVDFMDEDKEIVTANSPAAIEGIQFYVDLIRKHKVTPPGITTINLEEIQKMFAEGKVALFFDCEDTSQRFINEPGLAGKFGVGLLPHNKKHAAFGGTDVIVMSKQSKNKEAAWKFFECMVSPKAMAAYCKATGFSPARKSLASHPDLNDPIRRAFAKQMELGGYFYFKHPKAGGISPLVRAEVQQAMEGDKTVEAAMNSLQKSLEDLIRK